MGKIELEREMPIYAVTDRNYAVKQVKREIYEKIDIFAQGFVLGAVSMLLFGIMLIAFRGV